MFLKAYRNNDHNARNNGEAVYLLKVPAGELACVVDVGAHHGEWAALVRNAQPEAVIHCFEVTPGSARELVRATDGDDRVVVNAFGLGRIDERRTLFLNEHSSDLNSLVRHADHRGTDIMVEIRTGDSYVSEHALAHIDLLKIDTEGHDIEVLRGFSETLAKGAITMVQFEYNEWNIHSRVLLADFYDLLEPLGFTIGKVKPDRIEFMPYSTAEETWVGPACVAVLRSRQDLIARLS
ncbi:MAG: FkbM family methyltransferase [Ilumatobacter sp.]|uniref:FkbM family methyltransferase n=1 Tax=Ilumatobacter sp. TaxID=1967498 RepID=UPI003298D640